MSAEVHLIDSVDHYPLCWPEERDDDFKATGLVEDATCPECQDMLYSRTRNARNVNPIARSIILNLSERVVEVLEQSDAARKTADWYCEKGKELLTAIEEIGHRYGHHPDCSGSADGHPCDCFIADLWSLKVIIDGAQVFTDPPWVPQTEPTNSWYDRYLAWKEGRAEPSDPAERIPTREHP